MKRTRPSTLFFHEDLFQMQTIRRLQEQYKEGVPFSHLVVDGLFSDAHALNELRCVIASELSFDEKNNDLYSFYQSDDITKALASKRSSQDMSRRRGTRAGLETLALIRDAIYSEQFLEWLRSVTGFRLSSKVDMSCAMYCDTSYLLCHDDQLDTRKIAYIIYLVPEDWSTADGGSLDLFDCKQNFAIAKSIVPALNRMAFFEVSSSSYHQVAEVLSADKARISVSGWFHEDECGLHDGGGGAMPPQAHEKGLLFDSFLTAAAVVDASPIVHIRGLYFQEENVRSLRSAFAEESSVELADFLDPLAVLELCSLFSACPPGESGPPYARRCEVFDVGRLCGAAGVAGDKPHSRTFDLFRCTKFLSWLLSWSDCSRYAASGGSMGGCISSSDAAPVFVEATRWSHQSYSLCYDGCAVDAPYTTVLDCCYTLFVDDDWRPMSSAEWSPDQYGGMTTFMDADEVLLEISPRHNSFSAVLCDVGVMRFVKYINHRAPPGLHRIDIRVVVPVQADE